MIDNQKFFDLLQQCTLQDGFGRVRSYSGRAMFGKLCVALVCEQMDEFALALALASRAADYGFDDPRDIPTPRSDSLGRGVVLYWPQIDWPEGEPDVGDDEDDDEGY